MKWFWGLLVAVIGLLLLGNNFGFWGYNQLATLAEFWPILLILLGIAIIVRNNKFGWIIIIISFLASIIFVYYASFSRTSDFVGKQNFKRETRVSNFSEDLPSTVTKAKIIIETGAAEISISEGKKLISGTLSSKTSDVKIHTEISNNIATVTLSTERIYGSWWEKNDLNIEITDQVPVELVIKTGASSLDIDLRKINLSGLEINAGASSMIVTVGKTVNMSQFKISAGASSIKLNIPKDLGLKITADSALSDKEFKDFDKIENNKYQSKNYLSASNKADLKINAGASSITVESY